jgi:hypothetical protein
VRPGRLVVLASLIILATSALSANAAAHVAGPPPAPQDRAQVPIKITVTPPTFSIEVATSREIVVHAWNETNK